MNKFLLICCVYGCTACETESLLTHTWCDVRQFDGQMTHLEAKLISQFEWNEPRSFKVIKGSRWRGLCTYTSWHESLNSSIESHYALEMCQVQETSDFPRWDRFLCASSPHFMLVTRSRAHIDNGVRSDLASLRGFDFSSKSDDADDIGQHVSPETLELGHMQKVQSWRSRASERADTNYARADGSDRTLHFPLRFQEIFDSLSTGNLEILLKWSLLSRRVPCRSYVHAKRKRFPNSSLAIILMSIKYQLACMRQVIYTPRCIFSPSNKF